jgi:chromosome segregation ATPase
MDMAAQVTALRERVEEIEHTLREMAECHRETESRLDDIENKAADALSRAENLEIGLDAETERINRMEGV